MKHNAAAHKKQHLQDMANAMAQKKCHGMTMAQKAAHGAMPQQIMEGHGTKHNAMALITLPGDEGKFGLLFFSLKTFIGMHFNNIPTMLELGPSEYLQSTST